MLVISHHKKMSVMDVIMLIPMLLPTPGAPYDSPGLTGPRPNNLER
jgi:hypothetical protein